MVLPTPRVGGCRSNGLQFGPVEMKLRLEGDVHEEDDGYEEVAGVEDHVVPQAGLQLSPRRELPRLGEALHERKDEPGEELGRPVDNSPQVEDDAAWHVGAGLIAVWLSRKGSPASYQGGSCCDVICRPNGR